MNTDNSSEARGANQIGRKSKRKSSKKRRAFLSRIAAGIIMLAVAVGLWKGMGGLLSLNRSHDVEHVIMGWDYLCDRDFVSERAEDSGYNTVAPIWYQIEGNSSDIGSIRLKNTSDAEYVNKAHENGYRVWAMLSDGFSPSRSRLIFENEQKMNSIIDQIVSDVVEKGIDGVNVDFEGDGSKNREGFTRFVTALSNKLKEHEKVISVDVTGYDTQSLSSYYDREALSKVCDYIVLMGYDEHWSGSTVAGSVSSIGWVRGNVEKTLEQVPSEKLVLGVPFYTRTWRIVEGKGVEVVNTFVNVRSSHSSSSEKLGSAKKGEFFKLIGSVSVNENGKAATWYKINFKGKDAYVHSDYVKALDYGSSGRASSKAHAIRIQNEIVEKNNAKVEKDDASGQNIASYPNVDDSITKIWLEDETSIQKRMDIVKELGLAGVAAWRLGYEDGNTWRYIVDGLCKN